VSEVALRDVLTTFFDISELQSLGVDVGARWEELPGETLTEKAIALIEWVRRRGRYDVLIQSIRNVRPDAFTNHV